MKEIFVCIWVGMFIGMALMAVAQRFKALADRAAKTRNEEVAPEVGSQASGARTYIN